MTSTETTHVSLRFLDSWRDTTRKLVSVDANTYTQFFGYVPIHSTIHDQQQNPTFILLERELAIRVVSEHNNLKSPENFKVV